MSQTQKIKFSKNYKKIIKEKEKTKQLKKKKKNK